jgi:hypothetical protein
MSPEIGGPPSLVPLNRWANDPNAGPLHVDLSPFGDRKAPPTDLMKTAGVPGGTASGFGGASAKPKPTPSNAPAAPSKANCPSPTP